MPSGATRSIAVTVVGLGRLRGCNSVAMIARTQPAWLLPLVIALVLRLWGLGDVPATLTDDEARLGDHAWSLAVGLAPLPSQRGRGGGGGFLSPGEWQGPGAMTMGAVLPHLEGPLGTYATALSVGLLGPTPFAVRLPFAVAGSLSVIPAALVGHRIFGTRVAAVAAGLLLATSPWHLAFTRVARDGAWLVLGLLVMVAGMVGAGSRIRPRVLGAPLWLVAAGAAIATFGDPLGALAATTTALAVGLAHTRPSPVTTEEGLERGSPGTTGVPPAPGLGRGFGLNGLGIRWLFGPSGRAWAVGPVAVVLVTVAAAVGLSGASSGEFRIGPDRQTLASAETTSARRLAADPSGITGALQAPWAVLARTRVDAYASHFDLTFLFTRGGADRRDHATGFGQLSLVDLTLAIGGALLALGAAWSRRHSPEIGGQWGVIVAWLAVAPLPAALAASGHDASRSVGMVPVLALLEAGAVAAVWPRFVSRRVTFEARLVLGIATAAWALATAVHDPAEAGRAFGSGAFAGYEWARQEIEGGRAVQLVLVGDASQEIAVARFAMHVDPSDAGPSSTLTTRPEIGWPSERLADGAPTRLYALRGGARIPDGFVVAHVARTGDGRPAVTIVRANS